MQVDVPSRAVWGVNNMLFVGCCDILRLQTEVIRNNNMSRWFNSITIFSLLRVSDIQSCMEHVILGLLCHKHDIHS